MKQQLRKSAKALVLLAAFTGCLMIVYSCTSYFGESDTMLDGPVPDMSQPIPDFANLTPAQVAVGEKMLSDPDLLEQVQLSKAHRNKRFARMATMDKATLQKIITNTKNDNRKPIKRLHDLQLVFYTKEEIIQYKTIRSALFAKWMSRLTKSEKTVLLASRGKLYAAVAKRARVLLAAMPNARVECSDPITCCFTTPAICACLDICNATAEACSDEGEQLESQCMEGHDQVPPGENPETFCSSFYAVWQEQCISADMACATSCVN